ncbi:MAG: tetratricopeptide repeat protein, partial [Aureliella sp.]
MDDQQQMPTRPISQTPGRLPATLVAARCVIGLWLVLSSTGGCRWASSGQNTLGVRLYQQGRYAEALQQFQVAQTTDPQNPDTYYNLASTYH